MADFTLGCLACKSFEVAALIALGFGKEIDVLRGGETIASAMKMNVK
jgi:hypothetical protein